MTTLMGEEKVEATSKYGLKMLGPFVGSDEFVKANIMKQVESFETRAENLEKVENLQYRFLLLRHCFAPKLTYLLRNTRSDVTTEIVDKFESYKRRIFCGIIGEDPTLFDNSSWDQIQLAVDNGGMGFSLPLFIER